MLTALKPIFDGDKRAFFLHFFSVFTGIFVVMTLIILQIMRLGLYSSTENGLRFAKENSHFYVTREIFHDSQLTLLNLTDQTDNPPLIDINIKKASKMVENTDVILYDKDGLVLNHLPPYATLAQMALDRTDLETIQTYWLENYFGQMETYKAVTVAVTHEEFPEVAYATMAINTTPLAETHRNVVTIIISVMTLFWLLSIIASIYLANWSSRPILESFDKQKAFVENASHELRTPLAVLQNRLESLLRKPDTTILDNSENIASSLDEVRNMRRLTTNLLHLARRDEGIRLELAELDTAYFEGIFENYHLIANAHGKNFTGDLHLTKHVTSDKILFKQLLTILFDNAIKYTDQDGQITIRISNLDKKLLVTVADNGRGISDADKGKIFDRFYRVDKARTRQHGGFGLGLALAKQLADRLGGRITVTDNHPKGSIFQFTL